MSLQRLVLIGGEGTVPVIFGNGMTASVMRMTSAIVKGARDRCLCVEGMRGRRLGLLEEGAMAFLIG